MSFGDLIRLIHSLKSSDLHSRLYLLYGFNEEKTFPNYIEIIRQMRNNCAHGHPLFDLKLYKSLRAGKFKRVLIGDQGDLWSSLRGVLLVIQYFLFYLPGQKGIQFSKEIKRLMNRHRKEDIMEFIAYLDDIPWLKERL
ncbi:MAG: Abi family protein [bacterium]|nr:Abi family protein [bacterium]